MQNGLESFMVPQTLPQIRRNLSCRHCYIGNGVHKTPTSHKIHYEARMIVKNKEDQNEQQIGDLITFVVLQKL